MIHTPCVFRKLVLVTLLLVLNSNAQTNITIGKKAPEIHITDWIDNVPEDKNLSDKYIVLEFWATWCGPCIAAVPHMNELQKNIDQKDVYFISMTDESVEKVKRSLKRIDFRSIVVTDQTKKTHINFGDGKKGLSQYPLTVLIDKQGMIKWIGEPKELDQHIITRFINNQEIVTTEQPTDTKATETKRVDFMNLFKDKEQHFYFELTKANTQGVEFSKKSMGTELIELESATLQEIYANAFDQTFVEIPKSLQSQQFDLLYKNTDKKTSLSKLEVLLLDKLQLQKRVEVREVQTNDVSVANKSQLEETLEKRFSAKSDADGKIIFTAYTISDMLQEINKSTAGTYRYQGDNKIKYDFIIVTNSIQAMLDSFNSYGLNIEQKTKEQEYVVLEEK